jgi:uncharacterized protein
LPKRDHAIGKAAHNPDIFIDTSAWIALFSRRDQHHCDADGMFRSIIASRQPMLTTNPVLAEIHRLFLHRAGNKAAAAALEKIETSPLVRIIFADSTHHSSAKEWMKKLSDYPISYTAAISFSVMKSADCAKAMSFDNHFYVAGFDVLRSGSSRRQK